MNSFLNSFLASNLKRTIVFSAIVLFIFWGLSFFLWKELSVFLALLISSAFVEKFRTGNSFLSFGLTPSVKSLKESATGLMLTLCLLLLYLSLFVLAGCKISFNRSFNLSFFMQTTLLVMIMATNEELIFRGIIYQSLIDRFGKYPVTIIITIFFALVHLFNNGSGVLSTINTFMAGLLVSIAYLRTFSLWLPISFHFFWNFFTSFLLNSPVSGFDFGLNILIIDTNTLPIAISGGSYGIEGSLVTTFMLAAVIIYLLRHINPLPELSAFHFKREFIESGLRA